MVLLVAVGLGACTSDVESPEEGDEGAAEAPHDDEGCPGEVGDGLRAWGDAGFSGGVVVLEAGEVVCRAAYGRDVGVDSVFGIGSVSKAVTAAAVLDLVDEGKLGLDDRVGDRVEGLAGPVADATVEQLLLHTSGLTGGVGADHEPLSRDQALAALGGLDLGHPPGQEFAYSNAGYVLLALLVEDVAGIDYRDRLVDQVLPAGAGFWNGDPAPEGPRVVGYLDEGPSEQVGDFPGPHWALAGNGDVAMTVEQLATWTNDLFTGGVVSPAAVDLLTGTRFDNGDGSAEIPGWVSTDAELIGEPFVGAAGGGGDTGHEVVTVWLPESERVVTIGSNTPAVTAEALLQAIGPALVAGEPLPAPDPAGGDVDPDAIEAIAGDYELAGGDGTFTVTADDRRLRVAATGSGAVAALFPRPESVPADEVDAHADAVLALLAGETDAGREELAALAEDFGEVEDVALEGTILAQGELRTYVVATTTDGEDMLLWYALDGAGEIAAVEGETNPPSRELAATDEPGTYRSVDPTGGQVAVTVSVDGDALTVAGGGATVEARRVSDAG